MRSLVLAAAVCGLPLAAAPAAELTPTYPANGPAIFSWTGLYFGGNVGGAFGKTSWNDPFSGLGDSSSISGLVGGAQVGYNRQIDALVLGVEGNFSAGEITAGATDALGFSHTSTVIWTSTFTGKVGFAVDRALFYGKGGLALAGEQESVTDPFINTAGGVSNTASAGTVVRTGWTIGAGVEYAWDRKWSARIEYDYLAFGSEALAFGGPVLGNASAPVTLNIQRLMGGINYHF